MLMRRINSAVPSILRRTDLDDLFGNLLDTFSSCDVFPNHGRQLSPALSVRETDDAIAIEAELPGVAPKEIDITVSGQVLTIAGEKKESSEESNDGYYHAERRFGSFCRTVSLPSTVDTDKISAQHDKGVLTIRLAKRPSAVPKRIPVKS